ncbi:MAG: CDP-diacylglycerol--glycerol-3-phosphate 3-phosphatidyltransferase [Alphaproteobacteria bacterium]|nr:CDP-diacylglycerol--glycerol-3-phosphate 3-phosphatidyltransferase [Alphaproteobacteria bacterium]
MKHLPNLLTFFRIAILPVLILLLMMNEDWAVWGALALYIIASLSDFLDGYLARKFQAESDLGKFLDPIADKIFVASLFLMFAALGQLNGFWVIPPIIILMREFLISGLREFLGPKDVQLPVTKLAKWKTAIQMVAIGLLFLPQTLLLGQWGLVIAALLTIITGWEYLKVGMRHIKS